MDGHVVLVTGIDVQGGNIQVTVNDPNGRFDFDRVRYLKYPGAGEGTMYDLESLAIKNAIWSNPNDNRTEVSFYSIPLEEWSPTHRSMAEKGFLLDRSVADWEFLTLTPVP